MWASVSSYTSVTSYEFSPLKFVVNANKGTLSQVQRFGNQRFYFLSTRYSYCQQGMLNFSLNFSGERSNTLLVKRTKKIGRNFKALKSI